jgi:very-short-patch-repair endonuclease
MPPHDDAPPPEDDREFSTAISRARELRRAQTDAERCLWQRRQSGQLGPRFRRQHPIAPFIVDLCCLRRSLVVEVDGDQHGRAEGAARDRQRDQVLRRKGYRVLRFTNRQVLLETEAVVEEIRRYILAPSPSPLPSGSP